jgi:predicted transcriptional regulator
VRREEVLDYETRRRIYRLIEDEPGLHLRELERRSGIPLSTLRHHMRYLEEHHLVETFDDQNATRHFATTSVEPEDRRVLAALRQGSLRRVLLYILGRGGSANYQEILLSIGAPSSTLAVYLAQLTRRGLLAKRSLGRESRYETLEPERTIRLLHRYRASFVDDLVDHLLDVVYQDEP